MDIIHKVFVSSTYTDLREERAAVERTLLQLQCFPIGMEIFPAADDTAWDFIKSQIDDSDYYVLIVAGRYGSIEPSTGKSYTEMEYDYAIEKSVPVLTFIHGDPGSIHDTKRDTDPAARPKLHAFREKAQQRLCRYWTSAKELQAEVATTLTSARTRYKREGFVRASLAVDHKKMVEMHEEIDRLRARVQELEGDGTHQSLLTDRKLKLVFNAMNLSEEVAAKLQKSYKVEAFNVEEGKAKITIETDWPIIFSALETGLLKGELDWQLQRDIESRIRLLLSEIVEIEESYFFDLFGNDYKKLDISLTEASMLETELFLRSKQLIEVRVSERTKEGGASFKVREFYLTQTGLQELQLIKSLRE